MRKISRPLPVGRGVRGLDINSYLFYNFVNYKFFVQSHPRINKIQFKSNLFVCGPNVDLT